MDETCPWCEAERCHCEYCKGEQGQSDPLISYLCGSEIFKKDCEPYQSWACKQLAALQAQLADLREAAKIPDDWSFEDAKNALIALRHEADALAEVSKTAKELRRQNRELQGWEKSPDKGEE